MSDRAMTASSPPNYYRILDIAPESGLSRVSQGSGGDAIEGHWQASLSLERPEATAGGGGRRVGGRDQAFHRKVRRGYQALAKAEPERWLVLDASGDKGELAAAIWRRVEALILTPTPLQDLERGAQP